MTDVEHELTSWIDGEEMARRSCEDGTVLVITRTDDRYTLLRGFPLGNGAGVSVDLQDVPVSRLLSHLLERWSL